MGLDNQIANTIDTSIRPQFDFQHHCNVHNVSPWLCSMGVRHGHNTADTYGDSTSFTCVVKTHHQHQVTNTIPNTEVLQDCAQNGIPNFSLNGRNFFGPDTLWGCRVLRITGRRSSNTGRTRKEIQGRAQGYTEDMRRASQHLVGHRDRLWRRIYKPRRFKRLRRVCDALRENRQRRKDIQSPSNMDTFVGRVCARPFASRIGLHS